MPQMCFLVGMIHLPTVATGAHHIAHARGQMSLATRFGDETPSTGRTRDPLFKCASHLNVTARAPLFTYVNPRVVVSHVPIITIVVPFYKGWHGGNHAIVIVCVVHIQFVLRLVVSLIDNRIEVVPGADVELVGRPQGRLELLPLRSAAQDAFGDTFEKNIYILLVG